MYRFGRMFAAPLKRELLPRSTLTRTPHRNFNSDPLSDVKQWLLIFGVGGAIYGISKAVKHLGEELSKKVESKPTGLKQ